MDCAGESNTAYNRDLYKRTFPAMITDWRQKWYIGTDANTQLLFPFGFVQVYKYARTGIQLDSAAEFTGSPSPYSDTMLTWMKKCSAFTTCVEDVYFIITRYKMMQPSTIQPSATA